MGAKKDLKKLFTRFLLVVVYCVLGAAIFYAIEHREEGEKGKEQLFNITKTNIMRRFGINETELEILVENILHARSQTPKQWTYTRGIDLCLQTITTIGRYTHIMSSVNVVISITYCNIPTVHIFIYPLRFTCTAGMLVKSCPH